MSKNYTAALYRMAAKPINQLRTFLRARARWEGNKGWTPLTFWLFTQATLAVNFLIRRAWRAEGRTDWKTFYQS